MDPNATTPMTEDEKVMDWRLHCLINEANFPLKIATKIAENKEADLHRAVDLVLAGCTHETAAEIVL